MAKQDVQVKFSLVDGVSAGLAKIQRGLGDVASTATKVGVAATAATAAFAAFGAIKGIQSGIEGAARFEDAIARIGAVTGETGDKLDEMGAQVRDAAAETRFSAEQAAQGLNELAREGFNADEALGALAPTLALAQGNALSTAEAAGILADSLGAFGLGADQATAAADKLQTAAVAGGTGIQQLFSGLQQAGPAATQAGASLDEVSAALSLLASQGIEGGKAGSALRGIFSDLLDPTSAFSQELDKLGITSRDFNVVIDELAQRGNGAQAAIQALGDRGAVAMRALLQDGGGALDAFIAKIEESEGAAARASDALNNTFNGALDRLKNTLNDLKNESFEEALSPLTDAFNRARDAIERFSQTEQFERLKTAIGDMFADAVTAAERFIATIDFEQAIGRIEQFVSDGTRLFNTLRENAETAAEGVSDAYNFLAGAKNVIETGTAAATKGAADLSLAFGELSGKTTENSEAMKVFASISDEAAEQIGQNATELVGNFDALTGSVDATTTASQNHATAATEQKDAVQGLAAASVELGKLLAQEKQLTTELNKLQLENAAATNQTAEAKGQAADAEQEYIAALEETKFRAEEVIAVQRELAAAANENVAAQGRQGQAINEVLAASTDYRDQVVAGNVEVIDSYTELAGLVAALAEKYYSISYAAGQAFAETLTFANRGSQNIRQFGEAIERADAQLVKMLDSQVQGALNVGDAYARMAQDGTGAFDSISGEARLTGDQLRMMAENVAAGRSQFNLLDQATLNGLANTIDAAAAKVDALAEKARRAREELEAIGADKQDELDRAAGNEAAIEERRHDLEIERLRRLREQGGKDAEAAFRNAMLKEDALHRLRMENIAKEREARDKPSAPTTTQSTTTTAPRPNNTGGSSGSERSGGGFGGPTNNITINGFVGSDAEETARKLKKMLDDLNRQGR